ncbi:MAG: DUF1015 family protein, partial [Acidobacteria bacterium]|nr:DUF1015 family protein [Acidobacteriota bacterium]
VDDYTNDVIRRHERTRPEKEDDRTQHVLTLGAHAGPVFLTCRDNTQLLDTIRHDMNARPLYHFNAPDGITHTVWRVPDPRQYVDLLAGIDFAYVADGHHRIASAARAAQKRREDNPGHTGREAYNWFLGALFPASQLHILPYNRFVSDTGGLTGAQIFEKLGSVGRIFESDEPAP